MEVLFKIHAVTCRTIRTTTDYWRYVIEVKHPESFKSTVENAAEMAKETLSNSEVVVREKIDPSVYLYYRRFVEYFICVVAKHLNGEGYIITSYKTDQIKRGEVVWRRK